MGRNKKVSKRSSRIAMHVCNFGMVLLASFAMLALNLAASAKCNQLVKQIDDKSKKLKRLEAELDRSTARWDAMRSSDNLDRALVKWGISMRPPSANQIVRMNSDGFPHPGQTSVALVRQRTQSAMSASVQRPSSRRSSRR